MSSVGGKVHPCTHCFQFRIRCLDGFFGGAALVAETVLLLAVGIVCGPCEPLGGSVLGGMGCGGLASLLFLGSIVHERCGSSGSDDFLYQDRP